MKVFFALVILGLLAAGYGATKTYLDKRGQGQALAEEGVKTDADVRSVTEVSGRRIATYHRIFVSWMPEGGESIVEFAEILDCSGARYESGIETVRIVYLPEDPDVVRLEACESNFDANVLPGIVGVVFLVLGLLLLWRVRGMWRE